MASDGFKHITVTAAEDDEVILAGVREPVEEPEPESAFEPEIVPVAEPEPASAAEPEPEPAPRNEPVAKTAPSAKRDDYRETTLEDLESSSMPFMQKVVIVAAVVCIIGALVYYFVAMS